MVSKNMSVDNMEQTFGDLQSTTREVNREKQLLEDKRNNKNKLKVKENSTIKTLVLPVIGLLPIILIVLTILSVQTNYNNRVKNTLLLY
jgi:hypothetical protein